MHPQTLWPYRGAIRLGFAAVVAVAAILFLFTGAVAWTQTITGTILGTVEDPSGNVIVGAKVTLINQGTRDQRAVTTNETGGFVVPSLLPGSYTVRVESQGFQAYQRTDNILSATDRLSLGNIRLSLGSVTETVTVTSQGALVQTASAESSAVLTSTQIEGIAQRGRNIVGMLRLLPGVSTAAGEFESMHGSGIGTTIPNMGGTRSALQTMQLDGQQGQDNGSPNAFTTSASPDAVAEVKVLLNNYQAEFGRSGGAFINVVTKSGTQDFHGSVYWYKRHEMFNANTFFNNRSGTPKSLYRYTNQGFALGGPLMIPKVFNTSRQKLFFFYNFERNPSLEPLSIARNTMPTAEERAGNFSQTFDQSGKLMVVKDPTTGTAFPGNIIAPLTRINKSGQALLKIFPLPNRFDRNVTKGAYNYEFQEGREMSRLQHLFRVDYRATDKDSLYFRGTLWDSWATYNGNLVNMDFLVSTQGFLNKHATLGYTRILNSSMVNELNLGVRRPAERLWGANDTESAKAQRSKVGFTAGQFHPEINWDDIIPQASFSGVPSSPSFGSFFSQRWPMIEDDINLTIVDGLTLNRRTHTFKFGFYYEKARVTTGSGFTAPWMGNFNFGVTSNNPNDSGHPYGNAMLGNFQSYTEATARTKPAGVAINFDWYVQDSWRVTNRLTLEVGLRVAYFTPWDQWDGQQSAFALSRYDPAKAPVKYLPTRVGSQRRALNPLTGETGLPVLIGLFVPGSGDPANGMVTERDGNYPPGFMNTTGEMLQPRFGLAWDVFGNGKTAIRTGFAKFNQLLRYEPRSAGAPISYNPTFYYGNLDTFLSSGGVLAPGSANSHQLDIKPIDIYNLTFGIQQNIGAGTVLDAKYVSALGRHLGMTRNINQLPYGVRFLPQNIDPTTGSPLIDNFLRPYGDYGSITYRENSGSSNYHALQTTINRRFTGGLQFGAAYTYSKTMDYGTSFPIYQNYRKWNYGMADFDQTHILSLNYTYNVPRLSKLAPNPVVRYALDDWEISGLTSFSSGTPSGIGLSTTNSVDLTGGGDGQRVNVIGDPRLPHSEHTIEHMFNTAVFALPGKGDPGNAPRVSVRGPGINNWDLTLFKNFPIKSEQRSLQVRWEFYNLFNHTQFSGMDTTARFDPATGAQVNGLFGWATSARPPRLMQVSLRFKF